jgi:drug/metabolite transporter (DMT)-like permease
VRRGDLIELITLAALWGASFLFMRIGAGDFGPVALAGLRVAGAAAVLLPVMHLQGHTPALRRHWRAIMVVGLINSALPFVLFSAAALVITAGLSAIFNAATPMFTALIARAWLGERLDAWRGSGLVIGFVGVAWLAWDKAALRSDASLAVALAIAGCLLAALLYGVAANATRRHLTGVPPMAVAAGSQCSAALWLALPTVWWWPATPPSARAWLGVALLALLCTALAYVLYFRLIARLGPSKAITVTFLIPVFAVAWGWLILGEALTLSLLLGGSLIVAGTALAAGLRPANRR